MSFYDIPHATATTRRANPVEYIIDSPNPKYPPEVQIVRRGADGTPTPIGEKSDVWSIGSMIWALLQNLHHDMPRRDLVDEETGHAANVYLGVQDYGRMGDPDSEPPSSLFYPAFDRYSTDIKRLMAKCLNWNPEHRPTLMELRADIRAFLRANPDVRDDVGFEHLVMPTLDEGLRIGDSFVGKRRRVESEANSES